MKKTGVLKGLKKVLLGMCLLLFAVALPKVQASQGTVTLSIERCALGKGFIMEPKIVTFIEGETYADLVKRVLPQNGLSYGAKDTDMGFYLESIKGVDVGQAVPKCVADILKDIGVAVGSNKYAPDLSEFSYTTYSGWMYYVNNNYMNGMGNERPQNGDAVRMMFTLCYGADLTGTAGADLTGGGSKKYYDTADKSELLRIMGRANADRAVWSSVPGFTAAYQDALAAMEEMDANQYTVNEALKLLQKIEKELPQKPTAIKLSQTSLALSTGASPVSLAYTLEPSGSSSTVTWSSSNPSVASVNSQGKVTPGNEGTATITASTANGLSAECTVSVSEKPVEVEGIDLKPSKLNLSLDSGSKTLKWEIRPAGAAAEGLNWTSDNPAIATVSNGKVTPISIGETVVRVTTSNGKTASCQVVVSPTVTGITLTPSSLTLGLDDKSQKLAYTLQPSGAAADVTWTSGNPGIVSVDESGKITPWAMGETDITATTENGKKASCHVTVTGSQKSVFTAGKPEVTAKATSGTTVQVTWKEYQNAGSYLVYRRQTGSGVWDKLGTTTGLVYTDKTAKAATTYYYTVKAASSQWGGTVYSKFTTNVIVKTPVSTPAIKKAESAAYNQIKITWDKIAGASGYRVYRAASATGSYKAIKQINSGSTISYTDKSGLTTGKTYYYKVRAFRTVSGANQYGSPSAAKAGKPVPGKAVLKAAAGSKSAKTAWTKVSGATGYVVYRKEAKSGAKWVRIKAANAKTFSYTDKTAKQGKTYYYTVRAYRKTSSGNIYGGLSNTPKVKIK